MGLLKQKAANDAAAATGTTPPPTKTEEAPAPPKTTAGGIAAKDGKEGESYTVGTRVGTFQAVAGKRVFFVAADGAPFTCTAEDMISPATSPSAPAAPATPKAFGTMPIEQCKQGSFYVLDEKGTSGEFTGLSRGIGFFAVGDALVKLQPGTKVEEPKAKADNKVLPKDAPASNPVVPVVTKGGDDAEDEEEEGEEEEKSEETKAQEATAKTLGVSPEAVKPGNEAQFAAERKATKAKAKKSDPTDADLNKNDAAAPLILVVNGTPTRGTDLAPYVADMAAQLAVREKLVDIRLASKDSPLAYDGWKALMRASAIKTPPSGICFIYSGGLNDPVIEGLATIAFSVIRY